MHRSVKVSPRPASPAYYGSLSNHTGDNSNSVQHHSDTTNRNVDLLRVITLFWQWKPMAGQGFWQWKPMAG